MSKQHIKPRMHSRIPLGVHAHILAGSDLVSVQIVEASREGAQLLVESPLQSNETYQLHINADDGEFVLDLLIRYCSENEDGYVCGGPLSGDPNQMRKFSAWLRGQRFRRFRPTRFDQSPAG